jgi:hypothetical protein
MRGMHTYCDLCDSGSYQSLEGMVLDRPDGQAFFQAHPRIRALPQREVERDGVPVIVVSYESLLDSASYDVVVARDSYETLAVSGGSDE